jgi:hypothetical protein
VKAKSKIKMKITAKSRANVRIRRNNALEYYKILADNSFHSSSEKEKKIVVTKKPEKHAKSTNKPKVQKKTPDKRNNESDIHSDSTPITNNSKNAGESNPDDTTGIKKTVSSQKDKTIKSSEYKKEIKEKTKSEGKELKLRLK